MKFPILSKIKIIIAEDQKLVRKSMISLLNENKSYEMIGEAANGRDLLDLLKLKVPDVVLLDIEMPLMDGFEALKIIRKRYESVKIIMVSVHTDPYLIVELMTNGASSFISKACDEKELYSAISEVHKHGVYFNSLVTNAMLNKLNNDKKTNPFTDNHSLSLREIAVIKEVCEGHTNRVISEKLFISCRTVDFHKGNIYKKIGSNKTIDVIKYAIKHGIIRAPMNV